MLRLPGPPDVGGRSEAIVSAERYCTVCGTVARPATVTKGSMLMEIAMWLFFIVPGLIYSLWRLTTRHQACPACGAAAIVPLNSPAARARFSKEPPTA